jgi:hypothetical protein
LTGIEPLSQSFDLGMQRLNLALLPEDDIAEVQRAALQVRDLDLYLFERCVRHGLGPT